MSYFIYADAAENQENRSIGSIIDKINERTARAAARPEPEPEPPKNRRKKRGDGKRPDPNPDQVEQRATDRSYTVSENIVIKTRGMSLEAQGLYRYLELRCQGKPTCWPSINTMAEHFACSPSTIDKYLGELAAWKVIEETAVDGEVTTYRLTYWIPALHRTSPKFGAVESDQSGTTTSPKFGEGGSPKFGDEEGKRGKNGKVM